MKTLSGRLKPNIICSSSEKRRYLDVFPEPGAPPRAAGHLLASSRSHGVLTALKVDSLQAKDGNIQEETIRKHLGAIDK